MFLLKPRENPLLSGPLLKTGALNASEHKETSKKGLKYHSKKKRRRRNYYFYLARMQQM